MKQFLRFHGFDDPPGSFSSILVINSPCEVNINSFNGECFVDVELFSLDVRLFFFDVRLEVNEEL